MRESVPSYSTGDAIRVGDRITFSGRQGFVVFVVATRSYSDEYPEEQWSYLERGFMIEAEAFGLVHLDQADEDLILVERARPDEGQESASADLYAFRKIPSRSSFPSPGPQDETNDARPQGPHPCSSTTIILKISSRT